MTEPTPYDPRVTVGLAALLSAAGAYSAAIGVAKASALPPLKFVAVASVGVVVAGSAGWAIWRAGGVFIALLWRGGILRQGLSWNPIIAIAMLMIVTGLSVSGIVSMSLSIALVRLLGW